MLDEAGWTMGSDGIRQKDGKKLELELLYNSDSVTEKTIAEYLQSEYLKLGISINIHGEEEQSYRDSMKAGNFDMVFNICWGMPYDCLLYTSIAFICRHTNRKFLSISLGFSAGVMIYVSMIEIFFKAQESLVSQTGMRWGSWATVGAFLEVCY